MLSLLKIYKNAVDGFIHDFNIDDCEMYNNHNSATFELLNVRLNCDIDFDYFKERFMKHDIHTKYNFTIVNEDDIRRALIGVNKCMRLNVRISTNIDE